MDMVANTAKYVNGLPVYLPKAWQAGVWNEKPRLKKRKNTPGKTQVIK